MLALGEDGTLYAADNGRGSHGDGFIARIDLASGAVQKIVLAQTTDWRLPNGRALALVRMRSFPTTWGQTGVKNAGHMGQPGRTGQYSKPGKSSKEDLSAGIRQRRSDRDS